MKDLRKSGTWAIHAVDGAHDNVRALRPGISICRATTRSVLDARAAALRSMLTARGRGAVSALARSLDEDESIVRAWRDGTRWIRDEVAERLARAGYEVRGAERRAA